MPFTGGFVPGPQRTGGGDAGSPVPSLQRIFESIAARRGKAFDQTDSSVTGAETMAYARAIEFDVYGANIRFANEMNPVTSTVGGLLPRWEKAFGAKPLPTDTQLARQQRVAAAAAKFSMTNGLQGIHDALTNALGALFTGLTLITPSEALVWWPGLLGQTAKITAATGNQVTIQGLANVPVDAPGKLIAISNATTTGNDGTFTIQSAPSTSSVVFINNGAPVAPDNGILGSSGSPTLHWTLTNPVRPFMSTVLSILVQVNPLGEPGFVNADGTLNGAFYQAMATMNPVLDWLAPADHVFSWFILSSSSDIGFRFDEPDLDVEAFGS